MQKEGLTYEGRHHLLKQAQDKRGIAESLQVSINRARLTVCEVGVSSTEKKKHGRNLGMMFTSRALKGSETTLQDADSQKGV